MTAANVLNTREPLLGVGQVHHLRLRPAHHGFTYASYFLMLPMRALRDAPATPTLARNRWAALSFFDRDHGDGRGDCLAWLEAQLQAQGVVDADGEIWLQTYPRVLGYVFKPVSFWYCLRSDQTLAAVVAEVNNTFGERHCYVLAGNNVQWERTLAAHKAFHVSPFCRVEGDYRFRFALQGERIVARIEHHDAAGPLLLTSLSGVLAPATAALQRRMLWSHPLMTFGVVARIHWQALKLWLKKVPYIRKPVRPLQDVTRGDAVNPPSPLELAP
jgi:uncharacterized protein